jgi:hypothetical protein
MDTYKHTCKECGQTVTGGKAKQYCADCIKKHRAISKREYRLRNYEHFQQLGRDYKKAHPQKGYHPCPECGKMISPNAKLCSKCFADTRRGANNHNWKGGKASCMGYVLVRCPEHPRRRGPYVFEHILVWERVHGKHLPNGWVIHHLNGIKNDNRPVNLKALPSMKHSLVLAAKAKRIQELEAALNGQSQLL